MTRFNISNELKLPVDATVQTFAILAKRGAGKSYLASVMAEEMLKAGQQIVAIDPTGAWWGLRSGFPVVIFGGEHADVPLEESAGEVIAQAIIDGRISAVIDTSLFRKGQQRRFLVSFLETFYRLNRDAVHLFVDEADDVCPQKPFGDEAQLVGALEDVVKRGRKKGIGCSLITQRPAALNKDVLTQCEILVAMRLLHPLDIKAIKEWVNVHAEPAVAEEMIKSLPSLGIGMAWFWAPGWGNIFQLVKVRRRETFDSSSTPKPGEKATAPKSLKEIDLDALGEQIKATVQNAKDNDPAALKRRISELESAQRTAKSAPIVDNTRDLEQARNAGYTEATKEFGHIKTLYKEARDRLLKIIALAQMEVPYMDIHLPKFSPRIVTNKIIGSGEVHAQRSDRTVINITNVANGVLPLGERKILEACIQYPHGLQRDQLTVLSGFKKSTRDAYIFRLKEKGLVDSSGNAIIATQGGIDYLPDAQALPTGDNLRQYWLNKLPLGEKACLEVLLAAFPSPVGRDYISDQTGYKKSTRDAYLFRLSAKELVEDSGRGMVRASDTIGSDIR